MRSVDQELGLLRGWGLSFWLMRISSTHSWLACAAVVADILACANMAEVEPDQSS